MGISVVKVKADHIISTFVPIIPPNQVYTTRGTSPIHWLSLIIVASGFSAMKPGKLRRCCYTAIREGGHWRFRGRPGR